MDTDNHTGAGGLAVIIIQIFDLYAVPVIGSTINEVQPLLGDVNAHGLLLLGRFAAGCRRNDPADAIVGFLYVGTPTDRGMERPRPAAADFVTYWRPPAA